jgi:hypothetical protein
LLQSVWLLTTKSEVRDLSGPAGLTDSTGCQPVFQLFKPVR